jgi:protein SCO1
MSTSSPFYRRPWLWLGLGLALLAGVWSQLQAPTLAPTDVRSGKGASSGTALIGGPFALVDQAGTARSDKDLLGRYAVVYFGYSFCPDICPTDLAALSAGLAQFEASDAARGARIQPVFITVDPERDTVAAMKDFAPSFHPRLWALTGTAAQIDAAKKSYRVFSQKNIEPNDPKNYLVDHSVMFFLMGPDGKYAAHLSGSANPAQISAWLKQNIP